MTNFPESKINTKSLKTNIHREKWWIWEFLKGILVEKNYTELKEEHGGSKMWDWLS